MHFINVADLFTTFLLFYTKTCYVLTRVYNGVHYKLLVIVLGGTIY